MTASSSPLWIPFRTELRTQLRLAEHGAENKNVILQSTSQTLAYLCVPDLLLVLGMDSNTPSPTAHRSQGSAGTSGKGRTVTFTAFGTLSSRHYVGHLHAGRALPCRPTPKMQTEMAIRVNTRPASRRHKVCNRSSATRSSS